MIQLLPFHWTQPSSQNDIPLKSLPSQNLDSNNPKTAETDPWHPVRSAIQFVQQRLPRLSLIFRIKKILPRERTVAQSTIKLFVAFGS